MCPRLPTQLQDCTCAGEIVQFQVSKEVQCIGRNQRSNKKKEKIETQRNSENENLGIEMDREHLKHLCP